MANWFSWFPLFQWLDCFSGESSAEPVSELRMFAELFLRFLFQSVDYYASMNYSLRIYASLMKVATWTAFTSNERETP